MYAAAFFLVPTNITLAGAVTSIFSHFIIDPLKARYGVIKSIAVDSVFTSRSSPLFGGVVCDPIHTK